MQFVYFLRIHLSKEKLPVCVNVQTFVVRNTEQAGKTLSNFIDSREYYLITSCLGLFLGFNQALKLTLSSLFNYKILFLTYQIIFTTIKVR